jgi:predicted AAA+ superfamily ATPase
MFILSGSQNFLLMKAISQSLAGRVGVTTLLPLSLHELEPTGTFPLDELLLKGGYPRLYSSKIRTATFYKSYIQTYIERDVRDVLNVKDLTSFVRFLKLCAGRVGQVLNISSLANDCDISVQTTKSWLSILEASYVIHLLKPYQKNVNKRLIKSPKLYFYDTGLLCSLLDLESPVQVENHYLRGSIFENLVISDILKDLYNYAEIPNLSFWRDNNGEEVDLIMERHGKTYLFEVKTAATMSSKHYKSLKNVADVLQIGESNTAVIFTGDKSVSDTSSHYLNYKSTHKLIQNDK